MVKSTYSMDDSLGMQVVQTVEDLSSERLGHILVEPTAFSQDAGNRTTRNVFEEAIKFPSEGCQWYVKTKTNMLRYLGVSSNPRY